LTVEKYTPTIRKEKVLDIQGTEYDSKLDSIMDEKGFIKTRLNEEVIIQAVSHKLYKEPESGLRELYNNEAYHGCLVASKKHNVKNPYIKVSLNTETRKLIIQGFNSLGITEDVFTEILTELGTSGNLDRKKTGKFGMGFASYTKLSDIMILETQCINGDCYAVMAKGGLGFQKLPKPKLENTGTRLTLTLRKEVDPTKLVTMLTDLALTSGIKTYFELESQKGVNEFKTGLHTLEQQNYQKIFDDLNHRDDYSYLKSSFVNDDVEVHLSVGIDNDGQLRNDRVKKFYLCNSPIEVLLDGDDTNSNYYNTDEDEEPEKYKIAEQENQNYKKTRIDEIEFTSLVVNMKDEDIFEPMQDRERTTKNADEKIRKIVVDLFNETLKKIKPCEDLKSWFNHEHKYFISSSEAEIVQILDNKSKTVQKFLNTQVMEYVKDGRIKYDEKYLKDIIEDAKNYFYINKKDKRVVNLLEEHVQDHFLVMVHPDKKSFDGHPELYNDTIKTLSYFNFKEAKQYCKDNNFKATRYVGDKEEKTSLDVVLHYTDKNSGYGYYNSNSLGEFTKTYTIDTPQFNEIKDSIIRVAPFSSYRDVLKQFDTDFYLASDNKKLEEIQTVDDIELELSEKFTKWESNHGSISLEDILKHKDVSLNYEIFEDTDENSTKGLTDVPNSSLYIIGGSGSLFKLALVLIKNGINYKVEKGDLYEHYKPRVIKLQKSLQLIANSIDEDSFNDIFEFEKYLIKIRDFEIKVQDPLLRKLFKLSHDSDNIDEISKDFVTLNERARIENPVINRKESEYLS